MWNIIAAIYQRFELACRLELLICGSPASICFLMQFLCFFFFFLGGGGGGFYAKSVGFGGGAPDPDGGACSAPPYPLAGREGCPPPAPSPGRLRPTPCHIHICTAPPPPPPPPSPLNPGSAAASFVCSPTLQAKQEEKLFYLYNAKSGCVCLVSNWLRKVNLL